VKIGSVPRFIGLVLACGVAAGFSSDPALAVTDKPGVSIFASGPADQGVLLNGSGLRNGFGSNWMGLLPTWTANPAADQRYSTTGVFQLTGDPRITYTPTSTYAALNEFGSSPGKVDPSEDPVAGAKSPPVLDGFISTDEVPQNPQRTWAQTAAYDEIPLPVAQTPVAVIFSLPSGLTLGAPATLSLINNGSADALSTLQAIFDGNVGPSHGYPANTWGALLTRAGLSRIMRGTPTQWSFIDLGSESTHTGGYQPLELEVRKGDAPETDAIQSFLAMSGDQNMSSPGDAEQNWPSYANDGAGGNGYPAGPFGANVDGATLVKNTLATPGTIGYAVFADAVYAVPADPFYSAPQNTTYNGSPQHQYLFAAVQSDEGSPGARHYADPGSVDVNDSGALEAVPNLYAGSTTSVVGDCQIRYALSQTERVGSMCLTFDQQGDEWEGSLSDPAVYQHSANPNAPSANVYPIVELAYNTAWTIYGVLGDLYVSKTNATDTGNTVLGYLEWVTKPTGGQAAITSSKVGWEQLPSDLAGLANVLVGDIDEYG
jgi:hypothetical protein